MHANDGAAAFLERRGLKTFSTSEMADLLQQLLTLQSASVPHMPRLSKTSPVALGLSTTSLTYSPNTAPKKAVQHVRVPGASSCAKPSAWSRRPPQRRRSCSRLSARNCRSPVPSVDDLVHLPALVSTRLG